MKVALCEIKKNLQGTTRGGKKTRTQINSLDQKEEINIQPEQNKETQIQKNKESLREPLGQPETFQYLNYMGARRRRTRARN